MQQTYTHICSGTCSRAVRIVYDDENQIIEEVEFFGGCPGNTQGVAKLSKGRSLQEVHDILIHTDCRGRGTSCPDQLAIGIEEILNMKK
ncbi:MAG: TSCPD domain-containing protein [Bacilli bacterium]|nr:TSCPD domain-containing protein [Bacilli bacterium]